MSVKILQKDKSGKNVNVDLNHVVDKTNMNYQIKLADVVLGAFIHLQTLSTKGDRPRYEAQFHIQENDEGLDVLKDLINKMSLAGCRRPADFEYGTNCPLRKGNNIIGDDGKPYQGNAGTYILGGSRQSTQKPQGINILKKVKGVTEKCSEEIFYHGAHVHAVVNIYFYAGDPAKNASPRVCCSIDTVIFYKDGKQLSTGIRQLTDADFNDFADSEIDIDFSDFGGVPVADYDDAVPFK